MTSTAKNLKSLYDAIEALPVGVTGELVNGQWSMVNGQLYAHPRPSAQHRFSASNL